MAANLKQGEREGGGYDISRGATDSIAEGGNGSFQGRKEFGEERKEDAPGGDKYELNEGEGDGFGEDSKNRFG